MYNIISRDTFIWSENQLVMYLYDCFVNDRDIKLNFNVEGMCARRNGLYNILDEFCSKTNYDASRITLHTGNMLEAHDRYCIVKMPKYWYEVVEIQKWAKAHTLEITNTPVRHFGSFVGRSSWDRLWISAILDSKFKEQTIQTYNSGIRTNYLVKEDSGLHDHIGLDDLATYQCDILPSAINFLERCPRVIEDDIEYIKTVKSFIPQADYYPIQHPANLNILKEYNNIFLDIICETRITGNVFFVTEKTWRCVLAKRPFLVMGPTNFLSNLHRLGFKTFNKFWSECYDEVGINHRIKEIEQVLDIVSQWSTEQLADSLAEMQDILEHNYQNFMNLDYNKIKKVFS